jgi:hypothetical protein
VTDAELAEAGRAAVAEGMRLWRLDVGDPAPQFLAEPHKDATPKWIELHQRAVRWRETIDEVYTAAGWGASTPYRGNNVGVAAQWCGFFAAACWKAAGIDPKWLAPFFASTVRLYNWAHYRPFNQHKNVPEPKPGEPRRLVAKLGPGSKSADVPFAVREGDIVVIGGPHDEAVGRHITIARGPVDVARSVIPTIEGNGWGKAPVGPDREGIVMGERHIGGNGDHVMWIYRPAPSDIEPAVG